MSKTAATEALMGALHAKIAAVMAKTLDNVQAAQDAWADALANANPDEVMAAVLEMPDVSPAFLSAVTKFLADNKITCQPEDDANMGGLAQQLADKRANRKRRAVGNIVPFQPED